MGERWDDRRIRERCVEIITERDMRFGDAMYEVVREVRDKLSGEIVELEAEVERVRGGRDMGTVVGAEVDRLRAMLPGELVILAIDDALPGMMHAQEVMEWLDSLGELSEG